MTAAVVVTVVVAVVLAVMWTSSLLYLLKGWFAGFFHDKLEWHRPDNHGHVFDTHPESMDLHGHAHCKYCGKYIIPASDYGDWMVFEY